MTTIECSGFIIKIYNQWIIAKIATENKKHYYMPHIVKILTDDSGEKRFRPVWCLVTIQAGGHATFCGGEYFGEGESGCEYKEKITVKGGITCDECLKLIRYIKSIKL